MRDLTEVARQKDGCVGYVQPNGERAIPGQIVDANATANLGVGAYLLACAEMIRYIENQEGWKLVWSDEFTNIGAPDNSSWNFENGFVRNEELQWYQRDNATCNDGILTIEGRKEQVENRHYRENAHHGDWRRNRKTAEYTASSITTDGKREFKYGRFEVRAKIPVSSGSWPAIWTLGNEMEWPSNGEIDMLEYYQSNGVPHILANACWGTEKRFAAKWNS